MTIKNNNNSEFSARLKSLRASRSQREMADFLGLNSQATYANYELGRIPKIEVLKQIGLKCGVSLEWLLTGAEPQPSSQPDEPQQLAQKNALARAAHHHSSPAPQIIQDTLDMLATTLHQISINHGKSRLTFAKVAQNQLQAQIEKLLETPN